MGRKRPGWSALEQKRAPRSQRQMLENKADFHCDLGKSVLYRIDRTLGPFFNETNKDMHPPLDLALENEIATS